MTAENGFSPDVFADETLKPGFTAYEQAERELHSVRVESPNGVSSLVIDYQGAALHELYLGHDLVLVSAASDWLTTAKAKRDTSHTVLPFGPNGLQPQHGASRYSNYALEYAAGNQVVMSAEDRLLDVGHLQSARLTDNALRMVDEVVAVGDETSFSLGKHLYFALPEDDLGYTRVTDAVRGDMLRTRRTNGAEIEGTFGDFVKDLAEGVPLICQSTSGCLEVSTPDGRRLQLSAMAKVGHAYAPTQFALWHRPGTDTFCIEPLVGVYVDDDGMFSNKGVTLATGDVLRLETTLTRF